MTTLQQPEYFFELVNDSVMTRTMDGMINFWNRSAERLYGWKKEEAVGRVSHSLLRTQFPKPLKEIESELLRTGRWEGKLVHTTRNGGRVVVQSRWTLELNRQLGALVEINTPSNDAKVPATETATEHKLAPSVVEQKLTTLQRPEYVFELVNDSVMTRTMDGIINFWNHSAEKLYGWSKEEALGRVSHDLLQTRFPKPLAEIESELARKRQWEGRLVHTTRDGGRVVVQSRWALDDGHAGPLVEINTPITNHVNQPQARIETVNAATKVTKADDVILMLANIILAGGAFLCLLVSFYIIYYYGWTAQRYFSAPPGALLYCVLPAVLASLLFGFLRRSREFKAKAAIVSVSVALSVYAMELLTAFVMPPSSSGILWGDGHLDEKKAKEIVALAKQFGVDFDTRSRLEVIMDLQRQGIQAVPSIIPLALLEKQPDGTVKSKISVHGAEVLPVGGISHRVTVLCNEMGDYAIYDSDEHGFHNPAGIWRSPSIAVASVGDSFTQGACVLSDKNFMALIRNRYPSALNLGMSGEGPLFMLAALTEYLQLMKPPVVLWFFYEENDFSDLSKEHQSPLLRQYLGDNFTQGLFGRQAEIDESLGRYVEQEMKSQLAHKGEATRDRARKDGWYGIGKLAPFLQIAHLRQRFGLIYGRTAQQVELAQYNEAQFDLFDKVLARAKGLVEAWGGRLYFVYLPARDRYAEQQDYQRRSILNIVRHAGISIIDVHARFRQESDPLSLFPFGRFGHYNEKGNRLVAEEVLRAIELNGSHSEGP